METKKSKKALVSVVIIAMIMVIILAIILVITSFQSDSSKNKTTVVETEIGEDISLDSFLIKDLMNMVDTKDNITNDAYFRNKYFYTNDKTLASTLPNEAKLILGYVNLVDENFLEDNSFTEDSIAKSISKVLGENVTYVDASFSNLICPYYTYSASSSLYTNENIDSCESSNIKIEDSIIEAKSYSSKVEIILSVLYYETEGDYYFDIDLSNSVSDSDSYTNKYKYTFNYDENTSSYYFYSVEKVK